MSQAGDVSCASLSINGKSALTSDTAQPLLTFASPLANTNNTVSIDNAALLAALLTSSTSISINTLTLSNTTAQPSGGDQPDNDRYSGSGQEQRQRLCVFRIERRRGIRRIYGLQLAAAHHE